MDDFPVPSQNVALYVSEIIINPLMITRIPSSRNANALASILTFLPLGARVARASASN